MSFGFLGQPHISFVHDFQSKGIYKVKKQLQYLFKLNILIHKVATQNVVEFETAFV